MVLRIVRAGLVAALYVALVLAFAPLSFGAVQFRVAEVLTLLPFFWLMAGTLYNLAQLGIYYNEFTENAMYTVSGLLL